MSTIGVLGAGTWGTALARMSAIRTWNNNDYLEKVEEFKRQLGVVKGGNAASQVAEVIIKQLNTKKG